MALSIRESHKYPYIRYRKELPENLPKLNSAVNFHAQIVFKFFRFLYYKFL